MTHLTLEERLTAVLAPFIDVVVDRAIARAVETALHARGLGHLAEELALQGSVDRESLSPDPDTTAAEPLEALEVAEIPEAATPGSPAESLATAEQKRAVALLQVGDVLQRTTGRHARVTVKRVSEEAFWLDRQTRWGGRQRNRIEWWELEAFLTEFEPIAEEG